MKRSILYKFTFIFLAALLFAAPMQAQKKKATKTVNITGQIVDQKGIPVMNATVTSGEGTISVLSDAQGNFKIKTKANSPILVEAIGFETEILRPEDGGLPETITLTTANHFASNRDYIGRADGGKTLQRDLVGAVSKIDVEKMKLYPDLSLTNTMQGLASGLIVRAGNGGLGNNTGGLYVRGISGLGNQQAIVVVDGIERTIDDVIAEEIQSVEVLKDATAKALYGPRAANGVLLVTTKRGEEGRKIIRASAEFGALLNTKVPEFLDSYDYTRLYNEARANDGLAPRYSEKQIEGYKNSKGANDPFYPDVDWYDKFLYNHSLFRKAALEFSGGSKRARYSLVAGYLGGSGLEKIGKRTNTNQFNLRGNLDIMISRVISVKADVAGRIYTRKRAFRNAAEIIQTLNRNKPNEFPLTIEPEILGMVPSQDGIPFFGASERVNNNLYADLKYSGKVQDRYTRGQTNIGIDFNFDHLVKGLKAEAYVTFDDYTEVNQKLENKYATYAIVHYDYDDMDKEVYRAIQLSRDQTDPNQRITGEQTRRMFGWRGNISYANTFNKHSIGGLFSARYSNYEVGGTKQDNKNINYSLRVNYDYDKRYFFEVSTSVMGSNLYNGADKYFVAPTAGFAWVLSNERFLQSVKWIDFLKLKASAGILGYDGNATAQRYSVQWEEGSRWQSGNNNNETFYMMNILTMGNPDLKWEKSYEFNVGVEALLLSNRLYTEINYFSENRRDIIGVNTNYSSTLGDYSWLENIAETTNRGVDAHISWSDKSASNDFKYKIGLNFTFSRNVINKTDETPGIEPYRSVIGKRSDAIITYRYAGLFGKDVRIEDHPTQRLGYYTVGDIAYKDLNKDGIVDQRDQEMIGHTFPATTWGLDLDFNYKGFGLYMLFTAETNVMKSLANNYFQNYGEDNYSVLAWDRYHPDNNPTGTQPRLTTSTANGNSYRASEFWHQRAGFFRLKNIEISYTFRNKMGTAFYDSLKLFVRGTNLFVLTPMKDVDPERVLAGIDNYPTYRGITGGLSISF